MNKIDYNTKEEKNKFFNWYLKRRKKTKSLLNTEYNRLDEINSALISMYEHSSYNIPQIVNLTEEKRSVMYKISQLESILRKQPLPLIFYLKLSSKTK